MKRYRNPEDFLNRLPDETDYIRIRMGDSKRGKLPTVCLICLNEAVDDVQPKATKEEVDLRPTDTVHGLADIARDVMDDQGWGEDIVRMRIHAYSIRREEGKSVQHIQLASKQFTVSEEDQTSGAGMGPWEAMARTNEAMGRELVRMCGEVRSSLAIVTEALNDREEVLAEVTKSLVESRLNEVEGLADQVKDLMAAAGADGGLDEETKEMGLEVLWAIAEKLGVDGPPKEKEA